MPTGSATPSILVVEDESILRMMAVDMFETAGFHVIECDSGEKALDLIGDEQLAGLFTDVELAGSLSGVKLAHIVHDRHPDTPIIVVSGKFNCDSDSLPLKAQFLAKPYDPVRVVETLKAMIPPVA